MDEEERQKTRRGKPATRDEPMHTLSFENRPGSPPAPPRILKKKSARRNEEPPVLACRRPRKGGRRAGPASAGPLRRRRRRTRARSNATRTGTTESSREGDQRRVKTKVKTDTPKANSTSTTEKSLIQTDWPPSLTRAASTDRPDWPAPQSQSFSRSYGSNLPTSLTYINLTTRD